jgi:hypothetical protein
MRTAGGPPDYVVDSVCLEECPDGHRVIYADGCLEIEDEELAIPLLDLLQPRPLQSDRDEP